LVIRAPSCPTVHSSTWLSFFDLPVYFQSSVRHLSNGFVRLLRSSSPDRSGVGYKRHRRRPRSWECHGLGPATRPTTGIVPFRRSGNDRDHYTPATARISERSDDRRRRPERYHGSILE